MKKLLTTIIAAISLASISFASSFTPNASHSLNTTFLTGSDYGSNHRLVSYTVQISLPVTVLGTPSGTVYLEQYDDTNQDGIVNDGSSWVLLDVQSFSFSGVSVGVFTVNTTVKVAATPTVFTLLRLRTSGSTGVTFTYINGTEIVYD